MTTSQTPFLKEIAAGNDVPIPVGKLAYFEERVRHTFFDYVISKFKEKERSGLTRAQLARRIGKSPAMISRYLATPNNWTLDTVTVLLLGIAAEELEPRSSPVLGRIAQNYDSMFAHLQRPVEQEAPPSSGEQYLAPKKQTEKTEASTSASVLQ